MLKKKKAVIKKYHELQWQWWVMPTYLRLFFFFFHIDKTHKNWSFFKKRVTHYKWSQIDHSWFWKWSIKFIVCTSWLVEWSKCYLFVILSEMQKNSKNKIEPRSEPCGTSFLIVAKNYLKLDWFCIPPIKWHVH